MSILIKGVGMPRKCNDCLFERWEREYGYYCLVIPYTEIGSDWTEEIRKTGRREDCPLVTVTQVDLGVFLEEKVKTFDIPKPREGE